jgi:hypothetical protein
MSKIEPGTVYILETEGRFKVGHTYQDVKARVKQLQTGCPTKINIIDEIPSFFPGKLERAIHKILEPYRLHGEWFEPPDLSFMDFIGYIHKSEITGDFGLDFSDGPPFLRQSVNVELNNFSRKDNGTILLGSECITYSELEFNILRLTESLLKLLTWARQHGNLIRTPR